MLTLIHVRRIRQKYCLAIYHEFERWKIMGAVAIANWYEVVVAINSAILMQKLQERFALITVHQYIWCTAIDYYCGCIWLGYYWIFFRNVAVELFECAIVEWQRPPSCFCLVNIEPLKGIAWLSKSIEIKASKSHSCLILVEVHAEGEYALVDHAAL